MDEKQATPDNGKNEEAPKKSFLARWFPWLVGLGMVGILSVIGAIVLFIILAIILFILI